MTDRPNISDITKVKDHQEYVEDYSNMLQNQRIRTIAEKSVAQAVAPERSPMLSLVIDQQVIDLTINGDVEHLTINGRVAAIVIAK